MKAAQLYNGKVINVIEVDSLGFLPGLIDGEGAAIGDTWDGTEFIKPTPPLPTLDELKAARAELVAAIAVTTVAGNTFDGDEDSQNRMARAIAGMDDTDETMWVLANNALIMVGKVELREALRLAGIAMTTIWMAPYQ